MLKENREQDLYLWRAEWDGTPSAIKRKY